MTRLTSTNTLIVSALIGLTISACGDPDVAPAPAPDDPPSRSANNRRPLDPTKTGELPYDMMPSDMGGDDMSIDMTDMDMVTDMPEDITPDVVDDCAGITVCVPNTDSCLGDQIRSCVQDNNGCFVWGNVRNCPGGSVCRDDVCTLVDNCLDNDGDGYGMGCNLGNDCNDNDRDIHPGKAEVCDGIDNNCNNLIDEGIAGVGDSCSAGQGACMNTGTRVCGANGQVVCDAIAGQPAAMDTCGDGIDNDCNGTVDDGCPLPACANDSQEPNNSLTQAYNIAVNQPYIGFTCQQDKEFFKLNVTAGTRYRVNLAFPDSSSNLDLALFENNVEVFVSDSLSDHEGIEFTAQAGKTYHVEVRNIEARENFYRISLTDNWACAEEDAFEVNDSINYLNILPKGWRAPAYICRGNRDVFYIGEVTSGKTITINAFFSTRLLGGGDLDLLLYGDNDNDGTFDFIKRADTSGDNERLVHTTTFTGRYAFIVQGFNNTYNRYEIRWAEQ